MCGGRVILLITPESLMTAGFQMSFAAVVALISAYKAMGPRLGQLRSRGGWGRRVCLYCGGVLLTTLIAGTATSPFAAFHFNRVATYGLAAKLFAVPVMALWIMPWGLATYFMLPFGWQNLGLVPMTAGIGFVLDVSERVASWPGAVRLIPTMPNAVLILVTLGGLWLCIWTTRLHLLGVGAVAMGLLIGSVADPPDILINERGNLHAVRMNADEIVVSSDRPGFVRDSWLRRYGVSISRSWKALLLDTNAPLRCDSLGCQISLKGRRIAISKDPRAHEDDCNSVDILLSSVPVRIDCTSPDVVIDRFGLWREGTDAIYLKMGGVRVDTVQQYRGSRPWSP